MNKIIAVLFIKELKINLIPYYPFTSSSRLEISEVYSEDEYNICPIRLCTILL